MLTYREPHELSSDARSVVVLIEGTSGPRLGTVIASTVVEGGPQPVAFGISYPFGSITEGGSYSLYAGIVDGDLAWVTPTGVSVRVPQESLTDVVIPLQFRPDLLKAAVTGTITGVGLDPARDPQAYATALVIRVDTGETIGFQLISPTGAVPVPFSVPYDPTTLVPDASYLVSGSVWDGTTLWNTDADVPVITQGNSTSGIVMTVTPVPTPTAAPTVAPTVSPTPAASAEVTQPDSGGSNTLLIVLAVIGLIAVVGILIARNRASATTTTDEER